MTDQLSRREFLQKSALSAVILGTGVGQGCASWSRGEPPSSKGLSKVDTSWDRIIRTSVGLRPARRSGFRVETERWGDKTIVHNYGHGSHGVTLSWGTAHMAVEQALLQTRQTRMAVIGCGAVGLATARLLQEQGIVVTIYARELPPNTTSDHAEAIWDIGGRAPEKYVQAARLSHGYFLDLIGDTYGVRWIEQYSEDTEEMRLDHGNASALHDLFPEFERLVGGEHPFPAKSVLHWLTLLIEMPIYMKAVLRDFLDAGGQVLVRDLPDTKALQELPELAIVNCAGLGAKTLFDDKEMFPIKGQLTILMPQPGIEYTVDLVGDMVPRKDGILLGGTYEPNVWSLAPNEEAMQQYMKRHTDFFAHMRG